MLRPYDYRTSGDQFPEERYTELLLASVSDDSSYAELHFDFNLEIRHATLYRQKKELLRLQRIATSPPTAEEWRGLCKQRQLIAWLKEPVDKLTDMERLVQRKFDEDHAVKLYPELNKYNQDIEQMRVRFLRAKKKAVKDQEDLDDTASILMRIAQNTERKGLHQKHGCTSESSSLNFETEFIKSLQEVEQRYCIDDIAS